MAEIVQQIFETSILDLSILEKYGLFNSNEIRTILNKRKEFEYNLRKVNRNKDDFLQYLSYEENLLKLIRIRCSKFEDSNNVKLDRYEIEYNFIEHLKKLFEFTINKFKHDISLWLSYIDFVKKQKMYDLVSIIYFRMLQFHNKPWLWIQYAKFEFEEKSSSQTARKIMLKALSFHPESKVIWLEYFKFELLYCAKIRKRFKLFLKYSNEKSSSEWDDKQSKDNIWNGKLAMLVYKHAINRNDQFDFASNFIDICNRFDYEITKEVKQYILDDLKNRFDDNEEFWNLLAMNKYEEYKQKLRGNMAENDDEKLEIKKLAIKETVEIFEEACLRFDSPTMWEYYIEFRLKDLIENYNNDTTEQAVEILHLLESLWNIEKISIKIFKQWIRFYYTCFRLNNLAMQRLQNLLLDGSERWPNDLELHLFIACFMAKLSNENQKIVQKYFDDCLLKKFTHFDQNNADIGIDFWELYIDWSLKNKLPSQKILKMINDFNNQILLSNNCPRKMSEYFKAKILAIYYHLTGINRTRNYYDKNKSISPICKNFFLKMIEIEKHSLNEQDDQQRLDQQQSSSSLANVYEDLIHYFGNDDAQIWIDYIKYTMYDMNDVVKSTNLYYKALKCLSPSVCKEFLQKYAIFQASNH